MAALIGLARDCEDVSKNSISDDDWRRFTEELSQLLQRARAERGLTQEHVAYTAGITRTTYQRFEKNENRPGSPSNPELRSLVAIAAAMEMDLADLLPRWKPDLRP